MVGFMLGLLFLCVKGVAAVVFTRAHEFSPRFAAFCRIVSRPADGELGDCRLSIVDWGLGIDDWGFQGVSLGCGFV